MKYLKPYLQRVKDERGELNNRIARMENFLNCPVATYKISEHERRIRTKQMGIMVQYSTLLSERIDAVQ